MITAIIWVSLATFGWFYDGVVKQAETWPEMIRFFCVFAGSIATAILATIVVNR